MTAKLSVLTLIVCLTRQLHCDTEGDYIVLQRFEKESSTDADPGKSSLTINTLFHFRRPLPSLVDFGEPAPPPLSKPPQPVTLVPQGVGKTLGSWIWGSSSKVYTGPEIDDICTSPQQLLRPSGLKTECLHSGRAPPAASASSRPCSPKNS
jgi:hypothetical protein